MNEKIPTFGKKLDGVSYVTRVGAHAIVTRENGQICLVKTPNSQFYLPGGEIEAGEDQKAALSRELIEELGATILTFDSYLGEADDYYYSSHRDQHYYNPAHIWTVTVKFDRPPLEDFNEICWFDSAEAAVKLKRGAHKWAVKEFLRLSAI